MTTQKLCGELILWLGS